jgi:hypothetical protein
MDILEFYRKLVAVAKPAEIDRFPIGDLDPAYALWPHNSCADIIFEMNGALALHLDQTGTLNLIDETFTSFIKNTCWIVQAACENMNFYMPCSRRQNVSSMTRCQPRWILRKKRPLRPLVPICNVTIFSCRPWVFPLMSRTSIDFSCQPSSRKGLKWTASWIAWITSWLLIPCLRNSLSQILSCESNTTAPSSLPLWPSSTIMSDPLTVSIRPTLGIPVRLSHRTRALIISLILTCVLLKLSAPAPIYSVFVNVGATMLRTVNRWRCISFCEVSAEGRQYDFR